MSKTPRTDAEFKFEAFFDGAGIIETVPVEFARQLETELAEKNKLIEQMREALLSALANRHTCTCYDHDVYEQQSCICGAAETYERIKAALSAERGE